MRSLILSLMLLGQAPEPQTRPVEKPVEKRAADHFSNVTTIKNAVVIGDLATARGAARALGETDGADNWRGLRTLATRVSHSRDLQTAAAGLGQLGQACATCHQSLGGPVVAPAQPPGAAPGVKARMARHAWAAERMWLGLTAPSDLAWVEGSEALADAPLEPAQLGRYQPPDVKSLVRRVRVLGERAHAAPAAERAEVYGQLIGTCAACHTIQPATGGGK